MRANNVKLYCISLIHKLREGEHHLIAIYEVSIFEKFVQTPYLYCCLRSEESAAGLKRLNPKAMYVSEFSFSKDHKSYGAYEWGQWALWLDVF